MMKKLIALVCAAVMTIGTAATVLAQPSVQISGVVTGTTTAKDKDGNAVEVAIKEVPAELKPEVDKIKTVETLKEVLGTDFIEGMQVVDVKEVTVPEGTVFPVTITFTVTGVKADSKVAVLHYNTDTKAWEKVEAKAGNGTITATFTSLSPVAFVVDEDAAKAASTSPKTGESNVMMWAGIVAVAAAAGMGLTYKKRKEA